MTRYMRGGNWCSGRSQRTYVRHAGTYDLDLCAGAGNAIKGKRDQYVIATKFGSFIKDGAPALDASPEHIKCVHVLAGCSRWLAPGVQPATHQCAGPV